MAKYIYPAIFTHEDDGKYSIDFPDIEGCYTCGDDLSDSLEMAGDALALILTQFEDTGHEIPSSSAINDLKVTGDAFTTYISCDTTAYRRETQTVKKELSIPLWLAKEAEDNNISLSKVLQEALKEELHV